MIWKSPGFGSMDVARGRQRVNLGSTVKVWGARGESKENILKRRVNILLGHSPHFLYRSL